MRHTSSLSIAALIFIWNSCVKADLENEVKKQQQGLRGSQRGGRKIGRRRTNVRQQWARVFEDKMKNQMNFEGTGRK
jgi:PBP1b-binding outer membrane lipoprotein LpoB